MKRNLWFAMVILLTSSVMAAHKDYSFFVDDKDKLCVENGKSLMYLKGFDNRGSNCDGMVESVRIRLIDPPQDENSPSGVYLERPFLIIDGIKDLTSPILFV